MATQRRWPVRWASKVSDTRVYEVAGAPVGFAVSLGANTMAASRTLALERFGTRSTTTRRPARSSTGTRYSGGCWREWRGRRTVHLVDDVKERVAVQREVGFQDRFIGRNCGPA